MRQPLPRVSSIVTLLIAATILATTTVRAQTINNWTPNYIGNWSDGGGWDLLPGTIAYETNILRFGGTSAFSSVADIVTGANNHYRLHRMQFANSGAATISGTNLFFLDDGTGNLPQISLSNSASVAIQNNLILGTNLVFNGNGAGALTHTGFISDGGNGFGITKQGSSTVILTGNNNFGGGTLISGGTLRGRIVADNTAPSSISTNSFGLRGIQNFGGTLGIEAISSLATNGLTGRYFTNGAQYGASHIANNYELAPASVIITNNILTNSAGVSNAWRWVGKINITNSGPVTFATFTDDGSRLFIDGQLVIDNGGANVFRSGTIALAAGLHELRMDFGQGGGGSAHQLFYQLPGQPLIPVPTSALFAADSLSNNITAAGNGVALGTSAGQTIDLVGSAFTRVGMGNLTNSAGSPLTVTGQARKGLVFNNTSFGGGTLNYTNTPDLALGGLDGAGADFTLNKTGSGRLILDQTATNNNIFSTNTLFNIQQGTLVLAGQTNGFNPAGIASIQLSGGNLQIDTKSGLLTTPFSNAINVASSATIQSIVAGNNVLWAGAVNVASGQRLTVDPILSGAGNSQISFTGPLTGSGNVFITNSGFGGVGLGIVTLQGTNSLSGAINVALGTLNVSGSGSIAAVPSVSMQAGTTVNFGQNTNFGTTTMMGSGSTLIMDRAVVTGTGAAITVAGPFATGLTLNFGDLTLSSGVSTVTLTPGAAAELQHNHTTLTRSPGTVALIRGTRLGSPAGTPDTARITFSTPPALIGGGGAIGTRNQSIVPWLIGDSSAAGNGATFLTYGATGLRPLDIATELSSVSLSGVTGLTNYTSAGDLLLTNAALNALRLTGGALDLAGSGAAGGLTVSVNSGAILGTASANFNGGTLALGSAEGVFSQSGAAQTMTINTVISGSGGLTYSGSQGVGNIFQSLRTNSYTGNTVVNNAILRIGQDRSLGVAPGVATPGSLTLANSTLSVTTGGDINANRGLTIASGGGTIEAQAANTYVTYNGVIAGANTNSLIKTGAGTLVLGGANTYSGNTLINAGRVVISADSALGTAPATEATNSLVISGGALMAAGNVTLNANRGVSVGAGGATFEVTAGNTLNVPGRIQGGGIVTNLGPGTLVLTNGNTFTNFLVINGGTVAVQGNGGYLSTWSPSVNSGGTLQLGSLTDTAVNPNRLYDGGGLNLNGGSVILNGTTDTGIITENIGLLTNGVGLSTITLVPGSGGQVVLAAAAPYTGATGAVTVVRGTGLGSTGANSSRITFGSAPATIGGGGADNTTTISIVPSFVGDLSASGPGNTFVTYGANGLRPLNTGTELEATPLDNTSVVSGNFTTSGETLTTGNIAVNALRVTGGALDLGGFAVTNQSGAMLFTGGAQVQNGSLQFTNLAYLTVNAATLQTVEIGGVIANNTGITNSSPVIFSGNQTNSTFVLSGANTFTNAFINGVRVAITAGTNLGAGSISIAGGGGISVSNVNVNLGTTRTLSLGSGGGVLDVNAGSTLSLAGIISGAGATNNLSKIGAGTLVLSGANTFGGTVMLNAGTLRATGNAGALGAGALIINGGSLELVNDAQLNFDRPVFINGNTSILVDRVSAGAVNLQRLTGVTLGGAGGQTVTVNMGTNAVSPGTNPGLQFNGIITMTNATGATTFVVNTNGFGSTTILFTEGFNGTGDVVKSGAGMLRLAAALNFSGAISINEGTVFLNAANALGTADNGVTIASGATLDFNNFTQNLPKPISVSGAGVGGAGAIVSTTGTASTVSPITMTGDTTFGGAGVLTNRGSITGAFNLTKVGSGTLALSGVNPYGGATIIENGTLQIGGAFGALTATTGITVNSGAALTLGTAGNVDVNLVNRIPDAAPIALNRATLNFNSAANATTTETLGAVTLGGGLNSTVLNVASGQQAQLTLASVTRNGSSTARFLGDGLGGTGADSSRVMITAAPTLVGGIIPWATGDRDSGGFGADLVTYGANGVRPLSTAAGDYAFAVAGANSPARNVATYGETLQGNETINALRMSPFISQSVDVVATKTLTLNSGTIVVDAAATLGGNPSFGTLALGAAEGNFHLNGAGLTMNSVLTGSGGLTVSSPSSQVLTLVSTNTIGGSLNLNGAVVSFRTDANLGTLGTGAATIQLAGGTLRPTANMDISATRGITLAAGGGIFDIATAGTVVRYDGVISGTGTNTLSKATGTGTLFLNGANTYTGPTILSAGRLVINAENALGATPGTLVTNQLVLGGGTLAINTSLALSANRGVLMTAASTLEVTNGATLTINGNITSAAQGAQVLTKTGQGDVVLTGSHNVAGDITLNAGGLRLEGNNAAIIAAPNINVQGSVLTIGSLSDSATSPNRLNDSINLVTRVGEVRLNGTTSATTTTERVGTITMGAGLTTVTLTPAASGSQQVELLASNALNRANSGVLLVRGDNLGAAPAPGTTRLFTGTSATNTLVGINSGASMLVGGGGAAGTTSISIIPWAVGDVSSTGSGNTFVTYDAATGFRPLNTGTELSAGTISGNTDSNINFTTGGETLAAATPSAANAIRVTGGTLDLGANNLTNRSGAVLFTADGAINNGTLTAFRSFADTTSSNNANETVINLFGSAPVQATIGAVINGGFSNGPGNGLTVSGNNTNSTLYLRGANTFSNAVTVQGVRLDINNDNNLGPLGGAVSNSISLNNGTLVVSNASITTTRAITAGNGGAGLEVGAGVAFTARGVISGAGSLAKTGPGNLILSAANTVSGPFYLKEGAVFGSGVAGSLGAGTIFMSSGTTLVLSNNASTNFGRPIVLDGTGTSTIVVDRAAVAAAGTSNIVHTLGALTLGGQTLTVSNGPTAFGAGGLLTNLQLTFGAVLLTNSSTLQLDARTTATNILNLGAVNLNGYDLTVQGNAGSGGNQTNAQIRATGAITGQGNLIKNGTNTLVLSADNTFLGNLTINGGIVSLTNNGGTLDPANRVAVNNVVANNIGVLEVNTNTTIGGLTGDGLVRNNLRSGASTLTTFINDRTDTFSGSLNTNGTGGVLILTKTGNGTLNLTGTNTISSLVTVSGLFNTGYGLDDGGALQLSGNGQFTTNTAITALNNSAIILGDGTETTLVNRLSDSSGLGLNGSHIIVNGPDVIGTNNERVATINIGNTNLGFSRITLNPASTRQVELQGTLTRSGPSVVLVRGTGFGLTNGTGNSSRLISGQAFTTAIGGGGTNAGGNIPIIPWVVTDNTGLATGLGNTFATLNTNSDYIGGGYLVTPLAETDYATTLSGSTLVSNVLNFTTAGETYTGSNLTINSLRMTGGTLNLGGRTITDNSGALLFTGASTLTNGTMQFNTEGIITLAGAQGYTVGIGSTIAGNGGLTISGWTNNTVRLNGSNNFVGTVTINNFATVIVENTNVFNSFSPNTINQLGGNLLISGGLNVAVRDLGGNNFGTLAATNGNATITTYGAGTGTGLQYFADGDDGSVLSIVKNGSGLLTLRRPNGFSGGVTLNSGTLQVEQNTSLGNGVLTINGGTFGSTDGNQRLVPNNIVINHETTLSNVTLVGQVDLNGAGGAVRGLNVLGGNAVQSLGSIINGGIRKEGAGTLLLGPTNGFNGPLLINGGTLQATNGTALTFGTTNNGTYLYGGTLNLGIAGSAAANFGNEPLYLASTVNNSAAQTFTLGGPVALVGNTTIGQSNITLNGVVSGPGGLSKSAGSGGTLTLTGSNTFSGSLFAGGAITVSGNAGALVNVTNLTVSPGETVTLGAVADTQLVNRLNDAATIQLNSGFLNFNGPNSAQVGNVETNANISLLAGRSTITLTPGANTKTFDLTNTGALLRAPGATLFVRGTGLGGSPATSNTVNRTHLTFATAPATIGGGTNFGLAGGNSSLSVIPWVASDDGSGQGTFATYVQFVGVRPLQTAVASNELDYGIYLHTNITENTFGGTNYLSTNIARASHATQLVNAYFTGIPVTNATVIGTFTNSFNGGTLVFTNASVSGTNVLLATTPVNFSLSVADTLTGNAGVNALRLTNNTTLSVGPDGQVTTVLTNNSGAFLFGGLHTNTARTFTITNGTLVAGGGGELVFHLVATTNDLTTAAAHRVNLGSILSGTGGLTLSGSNSASSTFSLSPPLANTFSGPVSLNNSLVLINNAGALNGNGSGVTNNLNIGGAILRLNGFSLNVGALNGVSGTIDNTAAVASRLGLVTPTGTTNLYAGVIGDDINVVKTGTGTQILTGANTFSNLFISGGTLRGASNAAALGSATVFLGAANLQLAGTGNLNFARPLFSTNTGVALNQQITVDSVNAVGAGVTHTLGTFQLTNNVLTVTGTNGTVGAQQLVLGTGTLGGNPTINVVNGTVPTVVVVNGFVTNAPGVASDWLFKNGDGTLLFNSTNAAPNRLLINAGTVIASNNASALGASAAFNAVTLNGGRLVLATNLAVAAAFGRNVTMTNDSSIVIDRTALGTGTANAATFGNLRLDSASPTLTVSGTNITTGGQILAFGTLGMVNVAAGNAATLNIVTAGAGTSNIVTFSGAVSTDSGGDLVKSGNGTLALNGSSSGTLIGGVSVTGGTLVLGNATSLGNSIGVNVASGTTLDINGQAVGSTVNLTNIQGSGVDGRGALVNNSATAASFGGAVTRTGDLAIGGTGTGALTLSGALTGSGVVSKVGSNSLTLNNAGNTFAAGLNVLAGTVAAGVDGSLGATTVHVTNNAGVDLNGNANSTATLSIQGNGVTGQGALFNSAAGNAVQFARVTNRADAVYGVTGAGDLIVSNVITGSGSLSKIGAGAGTLRLVGTNDYTGATAVNGGNLTLAGVDGSIMSSASITITSNGVFTITNSQAGALGGTNGNRVSDSGTINLAGGIFSFTNDASAASFAESAGTLNIARGSNVILTAQSAGGTTSTLTLADLTRSRGATLNFAGTGLGVDDRNLVVIQGAGNTLVNGILGGWATVDNEFATYTNAPFSSVAALDPTRYNTGLAATWTATDNAKFITDGTDTLSGDTAVNSLNLQTVTPTQTGVLNLNGGILNNRTGGLLASGTNYVIQNGFMTVGSSGAAELITTVETDRTLFISAELADDSATLGLVKSGGGTLVLSNANSFSGGATLNGGSIVLGVNNAIPSGNGFTNNGGSLDLNNKSQQFSALNGSSGFISNSAVGVATLIVNNGAANSYAGNITGNSSNTVVVVKNGAGTLNLSGNNAFTGLFAINSGIVNAQSSGALGTTSNAVVAAGAAVQIDGAGLTLARPLTLSGTGVGGTGALRNLANSNTISGTISIGNGGALITSDAGVLTLAAVTLTNSTQPVTFGGAGNITVTGVIGGGGAIVTKDGNGTLILAGANTFTGGLMLNSGTLLVNSINGGALGSATGALALNGGTLATTNAQPFSVVNTLVKVGGNLTLGQTVGGTGQLTFNGMVDLGTSLRTLTINNVTSIFAGPLFGSAGFTKEGAGTLGLSTNNPFTGPVTVNNGQLLIGNYGALSASNAVILGANGRLSLNGFNTAIGALSGAGIVENANSVTNGQLLVDTTSATTSSALIQDGTGTGNLSLFKAGSGTQTLSGTNTFTGLVTVAEGALRLGNAQGLGAPGAGTVISPAATLDLNGQTVVGENIVAVSGPGADGNGALVNNDAVNPASLSGSVSLSSDTVVGGAGAMTLSGTLSGVDTLTKTGAGTLTLSGVNTTFGGEITNAAGVLRLGSASALGRPASGTTILSGATLDANGQTSAEVLNVAGSGVGGIGAIVNSNATAATLSGAIAMAGDTTIGGTAGNLTLSGVISGTGGLTKVGTNLVALNAANTFTGAVAIVSGAVQLGNAAGLGSTFGVTTVSNGATLNLNGQTISEWITAVQGIGFDGNGALVNNAGSGVANGPVTLTGDIRMGGATALTVNGQLTGSSVLTKVGAGTLTLSGSNAASFTGLITNAAGVLRAGFTNGLGATNVAMTVLSGATLDLNGQTVGKSSLNVGGAGVNGLGAILNSNVNAAILSVPTVVMTSDTTFGGNTGGITVPGVISGTANLTKVGSNTLTLTAANNYIGSTLVTGGTLMNAVASALPSATTLTVSNPGTYNLAGFSQTVAGLLGDGTVTNSAGTLTINGSASNNFAGAVNGAGNLTKSGSGTQSFSGTNFLTAALLVNGGTLQVNTNGFFTALSNLTVNGATLRLAGGSVTTTNGGLIDATSVLAGNGTLTGSITNLGTIAPGASPGALTINGNLTLASSANMSFEIGGLIATNNYDVVNVTNFVQFAGTLSLTLINGWTPGGSDTYTLVSFGSSAGSFLNTTNGQRMNDVSNTYSFVVNYSATNLVLSAPLVVGGGGTNDTDGDGQIDSYEISAGTDPNNSADYLHVTTIEPSGANYAVQWASVTNKLYQLYFSTNLNEGAGWQAISTNATSSFTYPDATHTQWIDDGTLTLPVSVTRRFYKVGLQ